MFSWSTLLLLGADFLSPFHPHQGTLFFLAFDGLSSITTLLSYKPLLPLGQATFFLATYFLSLPLLGLVLLNFLDPVEGIY
jgi:hypothetical protein